MSTTKASAALGEPSRRHIAGCVQAQACADPAIQLFRDRYQRPQPEYAVGTRVKYRSVSSSTGNWSGWQLLDGTIAGHLPSSQARFGNVSAFHCYRVALKHGEVVAWDVELASDQAALSSQHGPGELPWRGSKQSQQLVNRPPVKRASDASAEQSVKRVRSSGPPPTSLAPILLTAAPASHLAQPISRPVVARASVRPPRAPAHWTSGRSQPSKDRTSDRDRLPQHHFGGEISLAPLTMSRPDVVPTAVVAVSSTSIASAMSNSAAPAPTLLPAPARDRSPSPSLRVTVVPASQQSHIKPVDVSAQPELGATNSSADPTNSPTEPGLDLSPTSTVSYQDPVTPPPPTVRLGERNVKRRSHSVSQVRTSHARHPIGSHITSSGTALKTEKSA